jgi:hypothetical protein
LDAFRYSEFELCAIAAVLIDSGAIAGIKLVFFIASLPDLEIMSPENVVVSNLQCVGYGWAPHKAAA